MSNIIILNTEEGCFINTNEMHDETQISEMLEEYHETGVIDSDLADTIASFKKDARKENLHFATLKEALLKAQELCEKENENAQAGDRITMHVISADMRPLTKWDNIVNNCKSPNVIGEMLREYVFYKQNLHLATPKPYLYGGITTTELRPGFENLLFDDRKNSADDVKLYKRIANLLEADSDNAVIKRSVTDDIVVAWYSDGDTTLYFKHGTFEVINDDAKKDRNWKWLKDYHPDL